CARWPSVTRGRTASRMPSSSVVREGVAARRRPARREVPEGHRIAQAIHGRDAVIPAASRLATQQISGAATYLLRRALPAGAVLAAKAQRAGRQERDGDDFLEHRPVTVPADAGAGRVFRDQDLLQAVRRDAGEGGRRAAQRQQEGRRIVALLQPAAGIIVAPAERHHAALAEIAVELEGLERQSREARDQRLLLARRDHALAIGEAGGQR